MYTCPEKDIHSIYLDNELPEQYVVKYETHIASCPKCQTQLEQLKKFRQILKEDSSSLDLDSVFLQQSFERLQNRLRYTKVVSDSKEKNVIKFHEIKKYVPAAVAAAAVFAIMLPFNLKNKNTSAVNNGVPVAQIQPIKRTTDFSLDQNQLLTETSNVAYPISLASRSAQPVSSEEIFTLNSFNPHNLKMATSVTASKAVRNNKNISKLLNDDFFMPEFIAPEQQNVMQIYMPSYVDISALNK
ncbi:MAG: anti-sigma factor family protein [Treponema sp.]